MVSKQQTTQADSAAKSANMKEQVLAQKRQHLKDLLNQAQKSGTDPKKPHPNGTKTEPPPFEAPGAANMGSGNQPPPFVPPGATNFSFTPEGGVPPFQQPGGTNAGFDNNEFLKWAQQQAGHNGSSADKDNPNAPPGGNPFSDYWSNMGFKMPNGGNPFFNGPFGMPGQAGGMPGQAGGFQNGAPMFGPMENWMKAFFPDKQTPDPGPSPNTPPASPLVTMRSKGHKTPFFCVHALLGSVFHYHHLANLLEDDQPFYALQARGLDGSEEPFEKLEDFASLYLSLIREVQPKGPYKLGGYSFGAWVAYEMGRELIEAGEKVDLLFIMGTCVPHANAIPILQNMDFMEKYFEDYKAQMLDPFLSYEQRLAGGFSQMQKQLTPLQRIYLAHHLAMFRFVAKPYGGKITIVETAEQRAWASYDTSGGWKGLASEGLDRHLIEGNHLSMLEKPHIEEVAKLLSVCLNMN